MFFIDYDSLTPSPNKNRAIRLGILARRLRIAESLIKDNLVSAGYFCGSYNSETFLTSTQVDIVRRGYHLGIVELQKKFATRDNSVAQWNRSKAIDFLSSFVRLPFFSSEEEILNAELDEELIANAFYHLVYGNWRLSASSGTPRTTFAKIQRLIKLKIGRTLRLRLVAKFDVSYVHRYHIFPGEEEESFRESTFQLTLSEILSAIKEGALKLNYLIGSTWNEKQYYSLKA